MREPNPRLGRGLAALLGDVRSLSASQPSGELDIQALEPGAFQPRAAIGLDGLADLVASVRTRGILQPLLVRPHPTESARYQIIAGERRWRAAQEVGLSVVPCLIRTMTDADATAAALVENLQRVDLDAIEEAEGFRRLINEFGLTQEELGLAIGKSRSHVANALRLLGLPQTVSDYVRRGVLTAGHARAALACADPAAAAELMVTKGLSVRDAEALSTTTPRSKRDKPELAKRDADLRAVEADLTEKLGMEVTIAFNGTRGTVKIAYQTLDQLDHLIARLGRL
jgi:ParB family transcriptional regulator, chromosome partitioning protein